MHKMRNALKCIYISVILIYSSFLRVGRRSVVAVCCIVFFFKKVT